MLLSLKLMNVSNNSVLLSLKLRILSIKICDVEYNSFT